MGILKKAHFRRAKETLGRGKTLEDMLVHCTRQFPKSEIITYSTGDTSDALVNNHKRLKEGLFLHIATFEKNAGTPVIQMHKQLQIGELAAPIENEYIHSQLFLLCRHNDLLYVHHNKPLRENGVAVLINHLIGTFYNANIIANYKLVAPTRKQILKELLSDGIQEIDLRVGDYKQKFESAKGEAIMMNPIIKAIMSSFGTDEITGDDVKSIQNVMVNLKLRPGRRWKSPNVKLLMEKMVDKHTDKDKEELEEGIVIVTKKGTRITREKLLMTQEFEVDGNDRIIPYEKVRESLLDAFKELKKMKLLEE